MRKVLWGVALAGALFGSGCAYIRTCMGFKKPDLKFDRVELQDISLSGITLNLHFLLTNDNPIGIDIASLNYDFRVENHPFLSGHPPNGLHIREDATTDLAFPAHVNFAELAQTIEIFLTRNTASYQAAGSVGFKTPIGILTFPLSHSGVFDVPKPPDIQLQEPSISNLSFNGAHLNIPVVIHNRNGFPLPFGGLSGAVTVAGSQLFAPSIASQSALAAREQRVVNLGIDVNFLQSGMAVANAIRNRRADVGLNGTLNAGGLNLPVNVHQTLNFR